MMKVELTEGMGVGVVFLNRDSFYFSSSYVKE